MTKPIDEGREKDRASSKANARLIAAAPDLLAALKEARCWMGLAGTPAASGATCETLHDAEQMSNAVIARAERG